MLEGETVIWLFVAQLAVAPVPDWASYATAAINPTIAVAEAWKAPDRACRFGQLALAEGIGNGLVLTLKHFVVSPRPCVGCAADGFPSGHSANSLIGMGSSPFGKAIGFSFGIATGELRMAAHRHTLPQVAAGLAIGATADWLGRRLVNCHE